jgi:hypothetical protein
MLQNPSMNRLSIVRIALFMLGIAAAHGDVVLYSASFGGAVSASLNGQAAETSGATLTQHAQYGTNASATWAAASAFKADGLFAESGAFNSTANRTSATLAFTPQNGNVYHLTVTTSFTQLANPTVAAFHAMGFFETSGFTGNINSATGAGVWALTRPGDAGADDQTAHYNLTGGAGSRNAVPTTVEDNTAPSTLRITLDTTGGSGNWSAAYHVGNGSGGFTQLASVADLDAVMIGSVGIAVYNADGTARFQSFELRVVGGESDNTPPLISQLSPTDNASKVSIAAHIVATFDDDLITGSGNIVIKDLRDGSTTRTISVTDSSQVTLSGKVLTIIPATPLAAGRSYAVQIAPGAVKNSSDLPFAGIPQTDDTTWNFVTPANPLRIMPMGDSITVGYTNADWSGGAFEFGYRSGLYTLLSNAGYDFRFVGSSTEPRTFRDPRTTDPAWPPTLNLETLGQAANNGYAGKDATFLNGGISSMLASEDPDIILLKIGTNGYATSDRTALQTLVNTITTTKPACHLIIAQIMPRYTYVQEVVNYNTWIRDTLVPAQQALGRKVTVVDQYAPFLTNPANLNSIDQSLFSNAINHPSNPGYDKMAQVWFDAIDAIGIGPGSYSHWIRGFAGVGGQTGLNDDPDGDGLENGIENLFGTAPNSVSPGISVGSVNPAQSSFTFNHPQGVLAGDLTAAYQWSKDMHTFHGNLASDSSGTTVGFTIQANTPVPGTTTVTATVTGTPSDRLFLRTKVMGN